MDECEWNTHVDEDGDPTPFGPDQVPLRVFGSQPVQGVVVNGVVRSLLAFSQVTTNEECLVAQEKEHGRW